MRMAGLTKHSVTKCCNVAGYKSSLQERILLFLANNLSLYLGACFNSVCEKSCFNCEKKYTTMVSILKLLKTNFSVNILMNCLIEKILVLFGVEVA